MCNTSGNRVVVKYPKKIILALLMVHFSTLTKTLFLQVLTTDIETFYPNHLNVDDGSVFWFSLILKPLNSHAPIKTRRFKTNRLPYLLTPDI